ncbi:MAG TPA: ATP-binding protein, partial [Burkholderiales bacterium]|nr:ATP-binding protein [Burkholderiales bacterium]
VEVFGAVMVSAKDPDMVAFAGEHRRTRTHALIVGVMVAAIAIAHYATDPHAMLYHDVLRRATYLPIVLAAVWFGTVGGVAVALIAALLYTPHMFFQLHLSPNARIDQAVEMLLYVLVGGFSGLLVEREQFQRRQTEKTLLSLQQAHQDLRRHAAQVAEMQEALRQVERLSTLGELAADLAHEIRNPLASIRGTLQILSGSPPPEDKQRFAKLVIDEVDRLNRVVEGYLRAARAGASRGGRSDVVVAIRSVMELVRPQAERNRVRMEYEGAQQLLAPIDVHRLTQVFVNLMLNAVQAMPTGGVLRIECRAVPASNGEPGWAEVTLKDTGVGIAPENREKVFRPFFTTKASGTGVGLNIARRLVTEHGGTLTLDESTPEGSMFRLRFPLLGSA